MKLNSMRDSKKKTYSLQMCNTIKQIKMDLFS